MNLINRFLWHYWWGQSQYLQQRLDELEAEENNLIEDRRKVRARLMKAEARVITHAQIWGCEMGNNWPIAIGVLACLAIFFGALLSIQEQKLRCINTLKDKSAAEIRVVCK